MTSPSDEVRTYMIALDRRDSGERAVWIMDGARIVLGFRVDAKRQRWIHSSWSRHTETPPEDLATFVHDNAAVLDGHGFNVRRWWHLWPCWDCGAIPLMMCRHSRTGKPMSTCHRGRKPRGERP